MLLKLYINTPEQFNTSFFFAIVKRNLTKKILSYSLFKKGSKLIKQINMQILQHRDLLPL